MNKKFKKCTIIGRQFHHIKKKKEKEIKSKDPAILNNFVNLSETQFGQQGWYAYY